MGKSNGGLERWVLSFFLFMVLVTGNYPTAVKCHDRLRPGTSFLPVSFSRLSTTAKGAASSRGSRVYHVTDYGADPTGQSDASDAIMRAVSDAFSPPSGRQLMAGIPDLGGAEVHLDGGSYLISSSIRLPSSGGGNFKIHSGSLHASDEFPADGYLIELRSTSSSINYEYVTLRDVMLDGNYRCGGVAVVNSLRTTIDNLYVTHFATDGIYVKGGHETYVSNTYLGQHITAGADPGERNFSGTAINLSGNDNVVTDTVIFSAATGVLVAGQANTLSKVHCYNKATGWGGVGVYVKLPGLSQTRIVNSYMDYTGIVAEDPVQLHVSGTFFLGDANVVLKSIKGEMRGVDIVDNMFSGGDKGVDIVKLDGKFTTVEQVVVDRNSAKGMTLRSTTARRRVEGNGTTWAIDFSPVLLLPDRIDYVQYTMRVEDAEAVFVGHAIKNVTGNRVVVESDKPVLARVHVSVEQAV